MYWYGIVWILDEWFVFIWLDELLGEYVNVGTLKEHRDACNLGITCLDELVLLRVEGVFLGP